MTADGEGASDEFWSRKTLGGVGASLIAIDSFLAVLSLGGIMLHACMFDAQAKNYFVATRFTTGGLIFFRTR